VIAGEKEEDEDMDGELCVHVRPEGVQQWLQKGFE